MITPSKSRNPVSVIHCGLESSSKNLLNRIFGETETVEVNFDPEILSDIAESFGPGLIAVGQPPIGMAPIEVAQLLRMQYQDVPIFFLTSERQGFNKSILLKNGFTDVFLLPLEEADLEQRLKDERSAASLGQKKSFQAVKLIDLEPGVKLDFDTSIHLPANQKFIRLTAAGDELDQALLSKLRTHQVGAMFVERAQMGLFYQFCASQLKKLSRSELLSATEKTVRMRTAVREIVAGVFNDTAGDGSFEKGKGLATQCQQIVKHFIADSPGEAGDWYAKMLRVTVTGADTYSHAANVATYAVLFALGIGMTGAEDLGIAGLLHDLGVADLPGCLQTRDVSFMTEDERRVFFKHPEYSIATIQKKRIVLSEKVTKAILQHHERFDGSGFPHQLEGKRISKEAQVLGLADEFDLLTSGTDARAAIKPLDAIQAIWRRCTEDPSRVPFDPELVKQVLQLFPLRSVK